MKCLGLVIITLLVPGLTACQDSGFSGSAGKTKARGSLDGHDDKDGKGDDDDTDQDDNGGDDNDGDSDGQLGNNGSNGNGDSSEDSGNGQGGTIETDDDDIKKKHPTFGLLVNDLYCGMCHLKVNGNVASTRDVRKLQGESHSIVNGTWFGASSIDLKSQVQATGGFKENYSGIEVPKKFPTLNIVRDRMKGTLKGSGASVSGVHSGNLVITGTASSPMKIKGDVLVTGDLVIKGTYEGRGNIYVEGNIYIPFDLIAAHSAFPFPENSLTALERGRELVKRDTTDALGLATQKSIFIGDLQREQPMFHSMGTFTIYNGPETPPDKKEGPLGVLGVYNWINGGRDGYRAHYENAWNCATGAHSQKGSFNLVEAFLYAANTVAGVARTNNFAINGGIIADAFHVIARRTPDYHAFLEVAKACPVSKHPVHGYQTGINYVNYDWRIKAGLRILTILDFGHD